MVEVSETLGNYFDDIPVREQYTHISEDYVDATDFNDNTSSEVVFNIPSSDVNMIGPEFVFTAGLSLADKDGQEVANELEIGPINWIPILMFSDIILKIGNLVVEGGNNMAAMANYLIMTYFWSQTRKNGMLKGLMCYGKCNYTKYKVFFFQRIFFRKGRARSI